MSGFSYMIQQKLYQDKVFLAPPILSCIEARKRLKENNLTWKPLASTFVRRVLQFF